MDSQNISILVQNVKNGDMASFEALYRTTSKQVYLSCWCLLQNEADIEDTMQDTYLTAITHINQLADPAKFGVWVNQIAVNKCKNKLAQKNVQLFDLDELEDESALEENDNFLPENYAEQAEKRELVLKIMSEKLSLVQYETVLLYYFDGLNISEIASCMECPEGTVKYRLSIARKRIKDGVQEYEDISGTKLYSSTVPLLAAILFEQFKQMEAPNVLAAVVSGYNAGVTAASGIETAAKTASKGILATAKAKIVAAVIAVVVVAAGATGIILATRGGSDKGNKDKSTEISDNGGNTSGSGDSVDIAGEPVTPQEERAVEKGDYVIFGSYEQDNDPAQAEPIIWQVVEVTDGKATLVSDKVLDAVPFSNVAELTTWPDSNVRVFLNNEFYSAAFNTEEQGAMNVMNTTYLVGDVAQEPVSDKVALISKSNVYTYFDMYLEAEAFNTPYASTKTTLDNVYMLVDNHDSVAYAYACINGEVDNVPIEIAMGVRPLIQVNAEYLSSSIVQKEVKEQNVHPAFERKYRWLARNDFSTGQLTTAPAEAYTACSEGNKITLPITADKLNVFTVCYSWDNRDVKVPFADIYNSGQMIAAGDYETITMKYAEDSKERFQIEVYNRSDAEMSIKDCFDSGWYEMTSDTSMSMIGGDYQAMETSVWCTEFTPWATQFSLDIALKQFGSPHMIAPFLTSDSAYEGFTNIEENGGIVIDQSVLGCLNSMANRDCDGESVVVAWIFEDYTIFGMLLDMSLNTGMKFTEMIYVPAAEWQYVQSSRPYYSESNNKIDEFYKNSANYILPEEEPTYPAAFNGGLKVGDEITFGTYEQDTDRTNGAEPIVWVTLDVKDGKAMLVSKDVLDAFYIDDYNALLVDKFYNNAFTDEEKSKIANVNGANVSILTDDEATKYFADDDARISRATKYGIERGLSNYSSSKGCIYLLSSDKVSGTNIKKVFGTGEIKDDSKPYLPIGVRPVIWVNN